MNGIPEQPKPPSARRAAARRKAERSDEIRRIDTALDAIGVRGALSWGDDDEVPDPLEQDAALSLLLALRADIDDAIAAATIRPTIEPEHDAEIVSLRHRRVTRRGMAVVGVAAMVVSFGGVAAAAVTSSPGSALYGLHRVLTGAPAHPEQNLTAVSQLLDEADVAIKAGRLVAADALLTDAGRRLDAIGDVPGAADQRQRLADLTAALDAARLAAAVAGASHNNASATHRPQSDDRSAHAEQAAAHRADQAARHAKSGTSHKPPATGKSAGQGHQAPTAPTGGKNATAPSSRVTTPPRTNLRTGSGGQPRVIPTRPGDGLQTIRPSGRP
jgi:hypothetical protein